MSRLMLLHKFESVKEGFHRFCMGTSCHGFAELYTAKSYFWRIFWVLICSSAFGITIYQLYQIFVQYINQPTNTVIVVTDENSILYPPLKICFWHWLQWVDFKKALALDIDKSALLFSFNFYTRIFSHIDYNVDEAEAKLNTYMADNNYSSVLELHKTIARSIPIEGDETSGNIAPYFTVNEVIYKDPGFLFCYTAPSEQIHKYFDEHKVENGLDARKLINFYMFNENYIQNNNSIEDFVTYKEYNAYMLRWIEHKTKYLISDAQAQDNFTIFSPPILLYPNGIDEQNNIAVISETDQYNILLKGSVCQWQDISDNPCAAEEQSLANNGSCNFVCTVKTYKQNCSCIRYHYAVYMKDDKPDRVCRDEFYTLPDSGQMYLATLHTPNKTVYSQICLNDATNDLNYHACLQKCTKACEIWTYAVSLASSTMPAYLRSVGRKDVTSIVIEYPMGTDILVMIESNAHSWEVLVGNIGGLVGIWTGASIVSFIQTFYLCCCAENDGINLNFLKVCCKPKKRLKISSSVKAVSAFEVIHSNKQNTLLVGPPPAHPFEVHPCTLNQDFKVNDTLDFRTEQLDEDVTTQFYG